MLHNTLWNSFGTWLDAHRFGAAQIMAQQRMQHMALRQAILRMQNRKTRFAWRGWLSVTVYHQKREHTIRNIVRRYSSTTHTHPFHSHGHVFFPSKGRLSLATNPTTTLLIHACMHGSMRVCVGWGVVLYGKVLEHGWMPTSSNPGIEMRMSNGRTTSLAKSSVDCSTLD
jgi:hypothetical protein